MCPRRDPASMRKLHSAIHCYWCDRPFQLRQSGGHAKALLQSALSIGEFSAD